MKSGLWISYPLASSGDVDWGGAAVLSVGALVGGLAAARVALIPGVAKWIYRLVVLIVLAEVTHLVLSRWWH